MPKVLIIQENGRHEGNRNFRECFSLRRAFYHHGVSADVWGLGHKNYDQVPTWDDYDLIINLENHDQTGWVPTLADSKAKKFLWSIDAHVKGLQPYLNTAAKGDYDLILQATPEFVTSHNSVWFPNAYDDDLIVPPYLRIEPTHNVGFCGNVCNRGGLIDIMRKNCNMHFDEFVIGDSMVNAINSYKVHWNCNMSVDINYRNFETMGCNTFLITSNNKHYETLGIKHEKNCMVYNNVEEMIEMTNHILKHDDFRMEMAAKGYELVKKRHTYKNRAQQILEEFL